MEVAKAVLLTHVDGGSERTDSVVSHRRTSSTASGHSIRLVVTDPKPQSKQIDAFDFSESTPPPSDMAGPNIFVTPAAAGAAVNSTDSNGTNGTSTPIASQSVGQAGPQFNPAMSSISADKLIVGVDFGTTYSGYGWLE